MESTALGLIKLMRPAQWVKNAFVVAPLVFTGRFTDAAALQAIALATLLFCLASSATYILNDLKDIEADRRHPTKSKKRPLASGQVSPGQAGILLAILAAILLGGALVAPKVMAVIGLYLLLNLCYTFLLKHEPVIDIFIIAIGFVLRVVAGSVALSVATSSWMFVTTLCLALYLAAVKRRQELVNVGEGSREVLNKYTVPLIDRYAEMAATGALLFYSLFVMSNHPSMVISVPVVIFGLFRYWYIVEQSGGGESPTDALLSDRHLQATVMVWVALWVLILGPWKDQVTPYLPVMTGA